MVSQASSNSNGSNTEEFGQHDIGLLKTEASLDYLCNLPPHRFEHIYAKNLPESLSGEEFLKKYKDHNDPATVIDGKRMYTVKAATTHPIFENFRVKAFKALLASSSSEEQLIALGEMLYQIQRRYQIATGYKPFVFDGSSPGAGKFGHLKIRSCVVPEKNH